ncbi:DUF4350 domain-containing protein [Methanoregula sp.]|uniref:DUF4350 domain-containing protein n=1 Tax=Methanoregula sp. TaxID=2052170 RepID=UPI003C708A5D
MKSIRPAIWICSLVLLAAAFILLIHLSGNTMEFSRYNADWNGTSSFFSDLDRHRTVDITAPGELTGYRPNATLLILAPYRHPTTGELAAYRTFLQEGNTIFLADDFGTGNEILAGIGSRVSILPGNLSSLDRRYSDPYLVVVYRTAGENTLSLPGELALDRPAALDGGTPLMLTSVMSWEDTIGDRRLHAGEVMGTFPVLATDSIGPGRLIILSDPSIFINSMYAQVENGDNRDFIRNITSRDGPVLIDQMNSRTADANGFSEILQLVRNTVNIEIFILCLLMLCIAWAWKKKMI